MTHLITTQTRYPYQKLFQIERQDVVTKTACIHTVIERGTPSSKLGSFKRICAKLHKGGDCVYAMVH